MEETRLVSLMSAKRLEEMNTQSALNTDLPTKLPRMRWGEMAEHFPGASSNSIRRKWDLMTKKYIECKSKTYIPKPHYYDAIAEYYRDNHLHSPNIGNAENLTPPVGTTRRVPRALSPADMAEFTEQLRQFEEMCKEVEDILQMYPRRSAKP